MAFQLNSAFRLKCALFVVRCLTFNQPEYPSNLLVPVVHQKNSSSNTKKLYVPRIKTKNGWMEFSFTGPFLLEFNTCCHKIINIDFDFQKNNTKTFIWFGFSTVASSLLGTRLMILLLYEYRFGLSRLWTRFSEEVSAIEVFNWIKKEWPAK